VFGLNHFERETIMSSLAKLLIIAATALLIFGAASTFLVAAGVVGALRAVAVTPARATEIANQIVDFTLPAGYADALHPNALHPGAVDIAGFKVVAFTGADGYSHIIVGQLPAGIRLAPETLEAQLREARNEPKHDRERLTVVGSMPAVIRGQDVTLTIGEGINHDGLRYRQLFGVFAGKGGQAGVAISAPVSTWDQAAVDALLLSLQ
jgi:hypothetical protein